MFFLGMIAFFGIFAEPLEVHEVYSKRITEAHEKEILEPRRLCISSTGGSSDKGIRTVSLGVGTKGPGSINEGRKLLVFLVEDLLRRYNAPHMRQYLDNCPLTAEHLTYTISFLDMERGWLTYVLKDPNRKESQLAFISMYNGKVSYDVILEPELGPFTKVHTETYEEAKRIVEEGKVQNIP